MAATGSKYETGRFERGLVVARNCSGGAVAGARERQLGKLEDCVVRRGKGSIWREARNASVSHVADDELAQPSELVRAGQVTLDCAYRPKVLANSPGSPKMNSFFERETVAMK